MTPEITEKIPLHPPPPTWLDRSQPNALNLFRLLFALTVLFVHSWSFGRFTPHSSSFGPFTLHPSLLSSAAGHAVDAFFIISGFLITASWLSRSSADSYLRARILRIWPAFTLAFLLSALFTALAAGPDFFHYLRSIPKQSWLTGIFTLDPFELERPLAFPNNPMPHVVNGPLWTIRIEFAFYLAVALVGSLNLFRFRSLILTFTLASIVLATWEEAHVPFAWQRWARFASFFSAGSLFYLYRHQIPRSLPLAIASLLIALAPLFFPISSFLTLPFAGSYLLFYLAFSAPPALCQFGSHIDLSYGTYLYGGILQQVYFSLAPHPSPWLCFLFTLPACLALAALSWFLVEKPAKLWFR